MEDNRKDTPFQPEDFLEEDPLLLDESVTSMPELTLDTDPVLDTRLRIPDESPEELPEPGLPEDEFPEFILPEEPEEEEIFQVVEEQASFPGGYGECLKWLQKNLNYPQIAQENGVQGQVVVRFVVNKDGSIVDPVVVRSVDPYLDKEALRVVKLMPKWNPGKQRGKAVRCMFTLPVKFRLQ